MNSAPWPIPGRLVLGHLVLAATLGCGESASGPAGPPPRPTPTFSAVIAPALASLAPAEVALDAQNVDEEELLGLVGMFAGGDPRFVDAAREGVRELGPGAAHALSNLIADETTEDRERAAAIGLLGALHDAAAAEALLVLLETGEPAWVRTHAAWRLGEAGQDQVVPRVLLRLKYEKDREVVTWMADALGAFDNFAAAAVLESIVGDTSQPDATRIAAAEGLAKLTERAGLEPDERLVEAWEAGRLAEPERSPRFDHAVWAWIARLSEFQLRGVDDARFLLERSTSHVAELLGRALQEPDRYVRVHACQCLARMGPRARVAEAALVGLLGDRHSAHEAVAALGRLGTPTAEAELRRELEFGANDEVRVTAARAIRWRQSDADDRTRDLLHAAAADQTALPELRQAALETLAFVGGLERSELEALLAFAADERFESDTSILAVRAWLVSHAGEELLASYDERAPQGGEVITAAERRRSRSARTALVREALDELFPARD